MIRQNMHLVIFVPVALGVLVALLISDIPPVGKLLLGVVGMAPVVALVVDAIDRNRAMEEARRLDSPQDLDQGRDG